MRKRKIGILLSLLLVIGMVLSACGSSDKGGDKDKGAGKDGGDKDKKFSIAMVTDTGGVDDKSFNQSAWEGIKEFGEENGLKKGDGGYDYLESKSDADYTTNLNNLVNRKFDLIFGVGYLFEKPMGEIAKQRPDTHFAIVDSVVDEPNVTSIMFKDHEGAFLAGVAAALQTKTGKLGFVGGMESAVIERFESGFRAGVAAIDPNIEVMVNYTGSFSDASLGKAAANQMYSSGADIIFHASGATGNGVFNEAKERKQQNPDADVWVIGVDRDQYEEGKVKLDDGTELNITLTSSLKHVSVGVKDIATKAMGGDYHGGETVEYGLKEDGVGLAETGGNLTEDTMKVVNEWKEKIVSGEVVVPGTHDDLKAFIKDLK